MKRLRGREIVKRVPKREWTLDIAMKIVEKMATCAKANRSGARPIVKTGRNVRNKKKSGQTHQGKRGLLGVQVK